MTYKYTTPKGISDIVIEKKNGYVTKMFFDNLGYTDNNENEEEFSDVVTWLNSYFDGENPVIDIKYNLIGLTKFQYEVLNIVKTIPYGKTLTYGNIADIISIQRGCGKISAQAVGNAVKHNPILLLVPCHRVMGSNNTLVGYYGGLNNKKALLDIEGIKYKEE